MLSELEKVIGGMRFSIMSGAGYRYSDSEIAQAIIDRLEIDEDRLKNKISEITSDPCYYSDNVDYLAKAIAKIKPIKLREEK